ncbi:hypothetical protein R1sor_007530 [Riccia sorocarpa]|uniref:Uncharacterized protein n=1 Tax=Riccia sorocarpa TaxID=122646 RepID=A0ABD3HTB2_9MARC
MSDLQGQNTVLDQARQALRTGETSTGTKAVSLANIGRANDVQGLREECDCLQGNLERLEEKKAEFKKPKPKFVVPAREEALRLWHMLLQELDVAYRQTRMVHQDRWRDFALLGVASYAERHHPLLEVKDAMRRSGGKEDQSVYDIDTYWPTVCHSFDIEHSCTELCQDLGSHICTAYSNDGTAGWRYVHHIWIPLPKAVQEKMALADIEGQQLHAVSGGEAAESS